MRIQKIGFLSEILLKAVRCLLSSSPRDGVLNQQDDDVQGFFKNVSALLDLFFIFSFILLLLHFSISVETF